MLGRDHVAAVAADASDLEAGASRRAARTVAIRVTMNLLKKLPLRRPRAAGGRVGENKRALPPHSAEYPPLFAAGAALADLDLVVHLVNCPRHRQLALVPDADDQHNRINNK